MNDQPFNNHNPAAVSSRDGSRSVFILPPLAVILVGMLMVFLFLGPVGLTASAEGNGNDSSSQLSGDPASETTSNQDSDPNHLNSEFKSLGSQQLLLNEAETSRFAQSDFVQQADSISAIFTPEVQYWAAPIVEWANNAGVDPNLAATVMQIESCGDPRALSRAGAIGLFQVMPFHFSESDHPYDPDTNALRGLAYLKRSLDKANGDFRLALAGYNGGIGVIDQSESTWADETIRYTYWGSGIYSDAASGATESSRLLEWINANGLYLCIHAAERLGITP